ncbi:MAG: chromosome segregation protein SMC [Oscillospiraceae bacterium]|nr:chromosome segregation protein SMC [Oscillospiraceae bacterium]
MYLKSLEIRGFKSFPDKITLDFERGLTAVVGPNGSGKSNIGDAVSWVLGEQSMKNLRGAKMEDVIFSGTQSRKSVGFAEVTLCIDNASGSLSYDSDEVRVTRKLYRSGESEYLINGKAVRLKDVNELFMDTGLGKNGYSIIGQGRIAEIISAKSTDRREIFEEAAGISKFRYRKKEAVHKLEQAQVHFLRLKDSLNELSERVGPLKIQAEKAEKYLVLRDKKKELELSVWLDKLREIAGLIEQTNENRLVFAAEYDNLCADIARADEAISQYREKMDMLSANIDLGRREINELREENAKVATQIAICEHDVVLIEEKIKELKDKKQNELDSKDSLLQAVECKKTQLAQMNVSAADCDSEYNKTLDEFDLIGALEQEAGDSLGKSDAELNSLYIRRSELSASINAANTSFSGIDDEISEIDAKIKALSEEYENYKAQKLDSEKAIENIEEEISEHINKANGYKKLFEIKDSKRSQKKAELEKMQSDITAKQQKVRILSDLESNFEGFAGSVRAVLKASKTGELSGVKGSVAQLINVKSEYALAIETALGAAIQNVVVANENIAKRCIKFLQNKNAGRATFLPITAIKGRALSENGLDFEDGFIDVASNLAQCDDEFSEIIKNLLGKTVVCEDLESASIIAKKYNYRFKIVTLDGQVINAGGSFTGGSSKNTSGVLSRRNEIDELSAKLETLTAKRDILSEDVSKLRMECDKLRFDIEGETELSQSCVADKAALTAELARISANLEMHDQKQNELELQIEKSASRKSELQALIKKESAELEKCVAEIAQYEQCRESDAKRRDELKAKREALVSALNDIRVRKAELSKDIEATEREIENLIRQGEEIDSARVLIDDEIKRCLCDIDDKKSQAEQLKAGSGDTENKVSSIEAKIEDMRMERRNAEGTMRLSEKQIRELSDAREQVASKKSGLDEKLGSYEKERDSIITAMHESYSVTYSEAMQIAKVPDDIQAAKRELSDVNSKMKALGHVYIDAIEEYKEVSERYEFLGAQLDDVERSKAQLEEIIDDLTENMKKQFSESFNCINENFKQIFTELFGGGKAELVLLDPDDVLESGIDIIVAPPGKIFKNLMQFSGGEQAFVAIAIYFAILKLRPSPFCILDEIDAALDEVNVVKFAQYLRNFTDTTQFIIVTHKRGAMDAADVLYGVTMQSDGVSRLLKMSQEDVKNSKDFD